MVNVPFDRDLSTRLDVIIIAIEASDSPIRRAWLRWLKMICELRVPRWA
jgi:hypothetical protein